MADVDTATLGIAADALRLDGRVALVTGASKNIGAAIAASFAGAGADVLLVARTEERLEQTAETIRRQAPERRVETALADITVRADVDRLAAEAIERFDHVDILVNNAYAAGLEDVDTVLDVSDAVWERVFEANLFGPLRLTRALARPMLDSGRGGSVINLISGSAFLPNSAPGHLPAPTMAPYGVSKGALWTLTRYLASELAPHIRVNALCPGLVSEAGSMRVEEPYRRLIESGAVPMGRIGRPDEIAGAAVYLASPAASYTTGEVLICNGGRAW
jgi:NAD(P)-dependent dehydrogenase (short-subunit alcohol dehydrogenase family)